MIKIQNVSKTFEKNLEVLKDINQEIAQGEFVAITGRSGCGKTTLLNIIGTLDSPTSGKVLFENSDIRLLKGKKLNEFRNKNLGYIFQDFHLDYAYTSYQNVEIPLLIAGVKKQERKQIVLNALKMVGLQEKTDAKVINLSGGEKQRVAIARAIVNSPKVLLADEPCGNLDYRTGMSIIQLLRKLADSGLSVIMVTHNLNDAKIADRIINLCKEEVVDVEKIDT